MSVSSNSIFTRAMLLVTTLEIAVASMVSVKPAGSTVPEQIHLAFAGADEASGHSTGYRVSWFVCHFNLTAAFFVPPPSHHCT
jgi:hypothetical protein